MGKYGFFRRSIKPAFRAELFLTAAACTAADPAFPETPDRTGRNHYPFVTYFYIEEIEREDGEMELEFNWPLDPASVSAGCIFIDGQPMSGDVPYRISRKGTKILIPEPEDWRGRTVAVEVRGLLSANGTEIETIPPVFLGDGQEYERDDDLEFVYWYWYDKNGGRAFERDGQ